MSLCGLLGSAYVLKAGRNAALQTNMKDLDIPNSKLSYTIIQSLLSANEAVSDLLVVMSHALDEDTVKALTNTNEWENYMASKRELETTKVQIDKFTSQLKELGEDLEVEVTE